MMVLHVDIDAFFASVEQLLMPRLRGRPVAVGNGCVASCSYEARSAGVGAGMPLGEARRRCANLVVLDGQYAIYRCFAEQVWDVCRRYADGLETFLDEAYGEAVIGDDRPRAMGRGLQAAVAEEVGLAVSVGLAENRMLAKLASKSAKPAGVRWIAPEEAAGFVAALPVRSLPGVGAKTAALLTDLNIATAGELRRLTRRELGAILGARGEVLYERCRGRDVDVCHRRQNQKQKQRQRQKMPRTISRETTFHQSVCDVGQIRAMLFYLLERAMRTVRQQGLEAHTVEVAIRYDDWRQARMQKSLPHPTRLDEEIFGVAAELFNRLYARRVALRHVGVVLSGFSFSRARTGPDLFLLETAETHSSRLHEAIDAIRDRWGHAALVTGEAIDLLGRLEQDDYGFVLRTPSLTK